VSDAELDVVLNLALHPRDVPVTELNGPGRRFALWVQGCSLRCTTQCIAWQALDDRPRHLLTARTVLDVLAERARREVDTVEGVTFLGGEPTDQARGLAAVARGVRSWGWSVMTYTGHTYEHLAEAGDAAVRDLLKQTDILVDGPYLESEAAPLLRWRGSRNQRILFLSERYRPEAIAALPVVKGVDVTLTADGRLVVSGSQSRELVLALQRAFRDHGIIE
jgi:anaerobic ribonucleoside-triphosphate reductase activating protein